MRRTSSAAELGLEKENSRPPRKAPRKSVGGGRVSFGSVSVHEYVKDGAGASPTPAEQLERRKSLRQAGEAARQAEAQITQPHAPGTPPPPPPPAPEPEEGEAAAASSSQQPPPPRGLSHLSPPVSEASEQFFSPTESMPASPAPARLSTLLREDERVDEDVPALAALLRQDEANETMDVTMAIGAIKSAASTAAAAASPAVQPPPPLPPAAEEDGMDLTCAIGGGIMQMTTVAEEPEEEEEAEMELTRNVGSIKQAPGSRRRSSLSQACGAEQLPLRQPPEPAATGRRFSFHGVLATVKQTVTALGFSAAQPAEEEEEEEEEPPSQEAAPAPSAEPEAEAAAPAEPVAGSAGPSEPEGLATFETFLARAGVQFTNEQAAGKAPRRDSTIGASNAPGLVGGADVGPLAEQVLTTCVFQPKYEQLQWAVQHLSERYRSGEEAGLAEMEQHIQQEAPGFFSEPPVSEIPAQQIKKLKARCRQEARTFWYDWRAKLESATTNSLNGVMAGIEKDLEASEQHGEELDNLKKHLAETVQAAESQVGQLSEQCRSTQHQLAQREPALQASVQRRAEKQQELLGSEAELARLEKQQREQQTRLQQLTSQLSALQAPSASRDDAALRGDDLLEALQAGSCWRPSVLSSTRLVLCFGEHFELVVALDPRRGAVTSVELNSKLRPAAQPDARPAHVALLAALFPAVEAELRPLLAACESSRQLPALMQASSLRLGRLLELAREVHALGARMPLEVAALAVGGACITLHFSFFQTRAKFGVALSLHGEDPQQPLTWQLQPWAGAQDGGAALAPTTMVDAALLERTVADACKPHCTGFGRLGSIADAVNASFQTVGLIA